MHECGGTERPIDFHEVFLTAILPLPCHLNIEEDSHGEFRVDAVV